MNIYHSEAKENDEFACVSLAQIYKDGEFVPKDNKKAFKFYETAMKLNNAHATY